MYTIKDKFNVAGDVFILLHIKRKELLCIQYLGWLLLDITVF